MPVPFRLGGGQGFYNGVAVSANPLTDNFETLLNEGRLKVNSVDYNTWQPTTKQGVGGAFQNLINDVSNNYERFTPGYNALTREGGHDPRAKQLINAFTGQGLNFADDTGAVSLTPGGLNLQSKQGWSAGFNPMGGNINVGSFGLQGTWAGDKSIQATVNLGQKNQLVPGVLPPGINEFLNPNQVTETQYPLSTARQLMEEQTEDYIKRNPDYRYQ